MHEELKAVTGIKIANCSTCGYLGTEDDGGSPEYATSWDVCDRFPAYTNLKSFPFKKEMVCWRPEFWASMFSNRIKTGSSEEYDEASTAFCDAVKDPKTTDL